MLLSAVISSSAQAQWLAQNEESMKTLRAERMQMEQDTNMSILEKLEEFRIEDERKRSEEFGSLNFSVYGNQETSSELDYSFADEDSF